MKNRSDKMEGFGLLFAQLIIATYILLCILAFIPENKRVLNNIVGHLVVISFFSSEFFFLKLFRLKLFNNKKNKRQKDSMFFYYVFLFMYIVLSLIVILFYLMFLDSLSSAHSRIPWNS